MGLPQKPFDADKYLNGDRSWIADRLSPKDTSDLARWQGTPVKRKSRKPRGQAPLQQPGLVPKTRTPLYDPVSISPLTTGQAIPPPGVPDDAFFLKEHDACINEFIDVSIDEKDFICQWDAYALQRSLTSHYGVQKAMIDFVRENCDWFVQRDSRLKEFGSHATALTMKGLITRDCWKQCSALLREFFDQRTENEQGNGQETEATMHTSGGEAAGNQTTRGRGSRDCLCDVQPTPSEAVLCCGRSCQFRAYHLACLGFEATSKPKR